MFHGSTRPRTMPAAARRGRAQVVGLRLLHTVPCRVQLDASDWGRRHDRRRQPAQPLPPSTRLGPAPGPETNMLRLPREGGAQPLVRAPPRARPAIACYRIPAGQFTALFASLAWRRLATRESVLGLMKSSPALTVADLDSEEKIIRRSLEARRDEHKTLPRGRTVAAARSPRYGRRCRTRPRQGRGADAGQRRTSEHPEGGNQCDSWDGLSKP